MNGSMKSRPRGRPRGPKPRRPVRPRKALLVVNPAARNGHRLDFADMRATLARFGIAAEHAQAGREEDAHRLIRDRAADVDLFIVGGGDGTLSRLAPSLLAAAKPVGILPLGTANDFARTVGIPSDVEGALRVVTDGYVRRVDIGFVNERPFLVVATIGRGANVARPHGGWRKRASGVLAYPISWARAWRESRTFRARIVADGRELAMRCSQVAVGNGRRYGGGTASQEAEIDDGLLHLYCVGAIGAPGWLRLLPALRSGDGGHPVGISELAARSLVVETPRREPISVDGEAGGTTPATFRLAERALRVLAPRRLDSRTETGDL